MASGFKPATFSLPALCINLKTRICKVLTKRCYLTLNNAQNILNT
jgi:hypothetical protein